MGCVWGAWGCFLSFQGCFGGVGGCIRALRVIWECFLLNSHQYTWCTYKSTDIFQKTWESQMSQISKCPKVTVVLTYWEALGDVSELRYKSLLCFSSKRSYCILFILGSWLHDSLSTKVLPNSLYIRSVAKKPSFLLIFAAQVPAVFCLFQNSQPFLLLQSW